MIFDLRSHFGVVGRPSSLHYPNTCLYQIPNTNPNRVGRVVSLIVKELDKFGYIEGTRDVGGGVLGRGACGGRQS